MVETKKEDIVILDEWCKGCGFCVEFCPKDALELSTEFNTKSYHPPRLVRPEACTKCRLCELYCPEFAIFVREDEKD
ncbi:4Fe-4S binding protein [bacterium]|nr:4Fe-4S binding protein [bacterium]